MSTETKNIGAPEMESKELTPPVTVSMKKLIDGVGTVFAGVLQMLEALEPQVAAQLVQTAILVGGENNPAAAEAETPIENTSVSDETEAADVAAEDAMAAENSPEVKQEAEHTTAPAQATEAVQTVTVDDLTKIIVRKVKQDRSNNGKIGAILKTYGVAKVSELPTAKYEAFLTDISQL